VEMSEVVDVIFRETRLVGESMKFDSLELSAEEQFARSCVQFPLPPRETAKHVIEEVFWASMLTEEGRPCRPRLIYSPKAKDRGYWAHWLGEPTPLSRETLRKLMPTQGPLGFLVWDCEGESPQIVAVEGSQYGIVGDFTVAAPAYGALDVTWHCLRIVALRAGRIDCRSREFLPDQGGALNIVWKLLDSFDPIYLRHTIRSIAQEGHGGAIWVLKEGRSLDGIQVGHVIRGSNPPTRQQHQQRFKWLESVGNLAAVDGAVLIDSQLRVLGFGCFVDVPNSPRDVLCLSGTGKVEKRPSKSLGGGRHRSAIEFCCRFAPAAAIVVSEDGRISLMWAAPNEPPFWAPLSILGFVGDLL
jgi:hypothetical protein